MADPVEISGSTTGSMSFKSRFTPLDEAYRLKGFPSDSNNNWEIFFWAFPQHLEEFGLWDTELKLPTCSVFQFLKNINSKLHMRCDQHRDNIKNLWNSLIADYSKKTLTSKANALTTMITYL